MIEGIEELESEVRMLEATLKRESLKVSVAESASQRRWQELLASEVPEVRSEQAREWESYVGSYVDPREPLYDVPGFWPGGGALDQPTKLSDYEEGAYQPFWRTLQEHRIIQGTSRYFAVAHEVGVSLLEGLTDYAIHTGYRYKARPKTWQDKSDATTQLVDEVNEFLEEFHWRHGWRCTGEGMTFQESRSWGEQLLWVRKVGREVRLTNVPVFQLDEPESRYARMLEERYGLPLCDWAFGVVTDATDPTMIHGYFWDKDFSGANWEFIPATEAVHIKLNVPSGVKRGLSDFYPLFRILRMMSPLVYNMIVGMALQAAIAYVREASDLRSSGHGVAPLGNTASLASVGLRGPENILAVLHRPGTVVDARGMSYKPGPMGDANADAAIRVFEVGYRTIGMRYRMPEYMSSGNPSTSNRSTAETAETPFVKATERKQVIYSEAYCEMDWKALDLAARMGRFKQFGIHSREELEELVAVEATPPEVGTKDRELEASVNKIYVDAGIMSRQTWAEKAGLDYELEVDRGAEKAEPLAAFGAGGDDDEEEEAPPQGERKPAQSRRAKENCGTGAGGFQKGNKCAADKGAGDGGSSSAGGFSTLSPQRPPTLSGNFFIGNWVRGAEGDADAVRLWATGEVENEDWDRIYDQTQSALEVAGVEELTVYRGIGLPAEHPVAMAIEAGEHKLGDVVELSVESVDSWSDKAEAGLAFASDNVHANAIGVVLRKTARREDIIASYRTQHGFLDGESEVMVSSNGVEDVEISEIVRYNSDTGKLVFSSRTKTEAAMAAKTKKRYSLLDLPYQRGIKAPPSRQDKKVEESKTLRARLKRAAKMIWGGYP